MSNNYSSPFDWDFVDDKTLIYNNGGRSDEEIKDMINEALSEAVDDIVDEAVSSMDIKLEGEDLQYKLVVNGNDNGEINIPKDQFLKQVSYDSENKRLIFVMETVSGEQQTEVPMSALISDVPTMAQVNEISQKNSEQDEALQDVNDALASKADSSALETLAVKSEVTEEINSAVDGLNQALGDKADKNEIPDVSGFAVKSEVNEEINAVSDALSQFESQVESALSSKADVSALEELATKAEVEAVDAKVDAIDIPPTNRAFHDGWPTNTTIDAFCGAISSDPEAVVGESYLGELTCSGLPDGMGNGEVKVEILGDANNKILLLTATSTNLAPYHWELTYIDGDKYGWRAWVEDSSLAAVAKSGDYGDLENKPTIPSIEGLAVASDVTAEIATAVAGKANASDIPTRTSELENDSNFITSHQSLEEYAKKTYVGEKIAEVVGGAPETLDTLKEIADVLSEDEGTIATIAAAIETKANVDDVYTKGNIDDKIGDLGEIVEVEGQEATYWEEGDELPEGVEVGDVKTEAVEEVTREKSVKEYVDESVQTVNEKPEVMVLERKYEALLTILNLRDTDINNVIVNQELAESNVVTYDEGSIDNIVVPETTKSKTITAELESDTDLTLTSRYSVTINNTSEQATNLNVTAPAVENYNAATITLNGGEYDTITVTDASLTVQNGASVQNVVITQETTKNLTVNAIFAEGATVTSESNAAITLTSKNGEGEEVSVVLDAPGATVTMSGGSWVNVEANVSPNTLIINKNVHIENLNVTQGNVTVKVARQSAISSVVENCTLAAGYTIDYLHDDITSANVSKLTSEGTHTLTEDIAKNGRFAPGIFASDDIIWNLNNHDIVFTNTQGYANFLLRGTLHLEINGEGNVINNAGDYGFWTATEGAKVVVNGGHFEAATHVLYAEKGTIEVNGGSFKLTNPDECDKDANGNFKFLLNCKDENYTAGTANIVVRGGKFYGFNPAVTYGEPGGPVSYVAEGYHVVESVEDGMKVYTVVAD